MLELLSFLSSRGSPTYPGSVLLDISPVLVKLHDVQMLQLDQVVKHRFDFFLFSGNKNLKQDCQNLSG